MKKKLITLISIMLLAIAAQAAVTITFTMGVMYSDSGTPTNPLATARLIQIVVDGGNNGYGLTSNTGWANGDTASTVGNDDIIVGTIAMDSSTTGFNGVDQAVVSFSLTGTIGAGDPLMVRWFNTINTSATAGNTGGRYGTFRTTDVVDGSDTGWVVPADGNVIALNFYTASIGGSQLEAAGLSSSSVIPEPSTYAAIFGLVALGVAYLRRRK